MLVHGIFADTLCDNYIGTDVSVYGDTNSLKWRGPTKVGFQLDGIWQEKVFNAESNTPAIYHIPFFSAEGLENKNHTLTIMSLNQYTWYLDYIVYTTTNSSYVDGDTAAIEGGDDGGGGGAKAKTGAIAGGIVAGIAGLAALVFLAVIILRRRQNRVHIEDKQEKHQPFSVPPPPVSDNGTMAQTRTASSTPHTQMFPPQYSLIPATKNPSGNANPLHNSQVTPT